MFRAYCQFLLACSLNFAISLSTLDNEWVSEGFGVCSRWSTMPMKDSSPPSQWEGKCGLQQNWEPSCPSLQWVRATRSTLSAAGHYYCEKDSSLGCPFKCYLNGTLLRATAGLCMCVCVGQWACFYNVLLGRFLLLKLDQVCVMVCAWVSIYRAASACQVTVLIEGCVFVQDTNSYTDDIRGSVSITLCGVEASDSAGVSLEHPGCSLVRFLW